MFLTDHNCYMEHLSKYRTERYMVIHITLTPECVVHIHVTTGSPAWLQIRHHFLPNLWGYEKFDHGFQQMALRLTDDTPLFTTYLFFQRFPLL